MSLFASNQTFMQQFNQGLQQLAQSPELGAYILAMANATFDPQVYQQILPQLQQAFADWQKRFSDSAQIEKLSEKNPEDVTVFQQMLQLGFDKLALTEFRQLGPWEVQYNHLRSFRPKRMSQQTVNELFAAFNTEGFHFNKPFMAKEQLWQGELAGQDVTLFYNKYPFVTGHLLLVPQVKDCLPQFLTETYHHYVWNLLTQLANNLTGVGVGYNSRGAFASVNHLHFQLFVRQQPLPIQLPCWQHAGGEQSYPLSVNVFDQVDAAWRFIEQLHQKNIAYNLLYFPGRLYCVARKMQGHYAPADWNGGFSWYEVAGGQITFAASDFAQLDQPALEAEFAKLQIDV